MSAESERLRALAKRALEAANKSPPNALVPFSQRSLAPSDKHSDMSRDEEARDMALTFTKPIEETGHTVLRQELKPVTKLPESATVKPLQQNENRITQMVERAPLPWWLVAGLYVTAFILYGAEVGTNIWSVGAWTWDNVIPLAIAIGASTGLLFTFPGIGASWKGGLAALASVVFLAFALLNGFQLYATARADQTQARAERSTTATTQAKTDLDTASISD